MPGPEKTIGELVREHSIYALPDNDPYAKKTVTEVIQEVQRMDIIGCCGAHEGDSCQGNPEINLECLHGIERYIDAPPGKAAADDKRTDGTTPATSFAEAESRATLLQHRGDSIARSGWHQSGPHGDANKRISLRLIGPIQETIGRLFLPFALATEDAFLRIQKKYGNGT